MTISQLKKGSFHISVHFCTSDEQLSDAHTVCRGLETCVINGESHYGYLLKKNNNNLQPIYNQQVYYSWDQIGILSHKSIQLWTKSLTTAFHTTSTIKHS